MTALVSELAQRGYVHLTERFDRLRMFELADELGSIVEEERIELRPGARAYVAKPGPVPLHTDHPQVTHVIWLCERQDPSVGASKLLDTRPVVESLTDEERRELRSVRLACPPLAGGPPSLSFPVLVAGEQHDALFCSPWLQSVVPNQQPALDAFRGRLSSQAQQDAFDVCMQPGDVLIVDNRRMLHGRDAIPERSPRRLYRVWVRGESPCMFSEPANVTGSRSMRVPTSLT